MADAELATFSLQAISKSYGSHTVLRDLNLKIGNGELVLLLGANGSGKTTLLRICAGLTRPDSGTVASQGQTGVLAPESFGYVGHALGLYAGLTVLETIELNVKLLGIETDYAEVLRWWELEAQGSKKIHELSKGLQYRVALCRALLHNPPYLFLDEPTSSLDQQSFELLLERVNVAVKPAENVGFAVIATHDVSRLAGSATRVVVLQAGVIAHDSGDVGAAAEDALERKDRIITEYLKGNR